MDFGKSCHGAYANEFCAVSHRWEDPHEPDIAGVQFDALRKHLGKHPNIKFVWYDFWCMPQGKDCTREERADFKRMLQNINLIFLGMSVLIFLDLSYISRFWTQFEAWASMQTATCNGLQAAALHERRFEIVSIHNASTTLQNELVEMWATKTPEQAYELLSKPDVTVTNESDKDAQLPKLLKLNDQVKLHVLFA